MKWISVLLLYLACLLQPAPLSVTATPPSEPLSTGMLFTIELQIDGASTPKITVAPVAGLRLIETYPSGAHAYAYFEVVTTEARRIDISITVTDTGNSTVIIVPITVNGAALYRRALPVVWR